ncbi:hypothetical protein [Vibrio parahaemolyticus]|uniref:hypothetical protein n=1 Tax=Vibrio parahaemolyticus TaxID=670 RepID=UPI00235F2EFC|nr:hypothetical protein [Vibrio parahaemolyticus]
MKSDIFSESFNNTGELIVNPANGTLSAKFKLASISAGINLPATFDLYLEYRPIDGHIYNSDLGYTRSWVLCVPKHILTDEQSYVRLSNSSIQPYTPGEGLDYHKRQDLFIELLDNGVVRHSYKDGKKDYFFNNVITKIVSPSGHQINFHYDDIYRLNPFLERITNDQGDEIEIQYDDNISTIVQRVDGITRKVQVGFESTPENRDIIKNITYINDSIETNLKYEFTYKKINDQYYISTATNHYGNTRTFEYGSVKFDDSTSVPFICKQSDSLGDVIKYSSIGEKNYTGYEAGVNQKPYIDNCFYKDYEYNYTTLEESNGNRVEREYNKFHCLVREARRETLYYTGLHTIDKTITYHNTEGTIDVQPAQYLDIKEVNTVLTDVDGKQTEKREYYETDIYGNLTYIISPENLETRRYYSISSVDDRFKNNLYCEEVSSEDTTKVTEIEYSTYNGLTYNIPYLSDRVTAKCELPTTFYFNKNKTKEVSYLENSSVNNFLLATERKILFSHKDVLTVNYIFNERLGAVESIENYSWSNLSASKRYIFKPTLNQTILEIDFDNIETSYDYDKNGILTKKTKHSNTESPYIEEYKYDLSEPSTNTYIIVKDGIETKFKYDVQLKLIEEYRNDFLIKKCTYHETDLGSLLVDETLYDRINGMDTSEEYIKTYTRRGNHFQNSTCKYNGNEITVNRLLGSNSKTTQSNSGDVVEEFYNLEGELIKVELNNNPYIENQLDTFGRVKSRNVYSEFNGVSQSTFDYDILDRVTQEVVSTNEGSDSYRYSYPSLYVDMPSEIDVTSTFDDFNNNPRREIDPLGRVINEGYLILGNYKKKKTFEYMGGESIPYRVIDEFGGVSYECEVDNGVIKSETINNYNSGPQLFTYERDKYQRIIKCISNMNGDKYLESNYRFTDGDLTKIEDSVFYPSGLRLSLTTQLSKSGKRKSNQSISFSNSGESENNKSKHSDIVINYNYDMYGRLSYKMYEDHAMVMASYNNEFDLPYNITSTFGIYNENQNQLLLQVDFEYDENGIEISREFKIQGELLFKYEITEIDEISKKIKKEVLSRNDSQSDNINKTYLYSELGELKQSTIKKESGSLTTNYQYSGVGRIKSANDVRPKEFFYEELESQASDKLFLIRNNYTSVRIVYDYADNVTSINNDIKFNHDVNGKVLNSHSKEETPGIGDDYEYYYNHKEQLVRLLKKDVYSSRVIQEVLFIYSDDELVGEYDITNGIKTKYIRFNNIILGKFSQKGTVNELSIYGTDRNGSVYATYHLKNENMKYLEHDLEYKSYSDYGESETW